MPTPIPPQDYWSHGLRVKICGITRPEQGIAIANLGVHALGFICVPSSPRYISPEQIRSITQQLPQSHRPLAHIGVFANADLGIIQETVNIGQLTSIQLHGQESPHQCRQLRTALPDIELIKAIRVRSQQSLQEIAPYLEHLDALLLDAYTPNSLGGTGETWDWSIVSDFSPTCPWFLAGGLTPHNIHQALTQTKPNGIDLSSGVEQAPGDKDIQLVQQLCQQLQRL